MSVARPVGTEAHGIPIGHALDRADPGSPAMAADAPDMTYGFDPPNRSSFADTPVSGKHPIRKAAIGADQGAWYRRQNRVLNEKFRKNP